MYFYLRLKWPVVKVRRNDTFESFGFRKLETDGVLVELTILS